MKNITDYYTVSLKFEMCSLSLLPLRRLDTRCRVTSRPVCYISRQNLSPFSRLGFEEKLVRTLRTKFGTTNQREGWLHPCQCKSSYIRSPLSIFHTLASPPSRNNTTLWLTYIFLLPCESGATISPEDLEKSSGSTQCALCHGCRNEIRSSYKSITLA